MKKFISLVLALLMVLSLASCSAPAESKPSTEKTETKTETVTKEGPKDSKADPETAKPEETKEPEKEPEPKPLENLNLSIDKEELNLYRLDEETIEISNPDEAKLSLDVSSDVVLAELNENTITVKANKQGSAEIKVLATKDGFNDLTLTANVNVSLRAVTIKYYDKVTVSEGETTTTTVSANAEGAEFEISVSGDISAEIDGDTITIEGDSQGKGTINVTAKAPNFKDSTVTINVTVAAPKKSLPSSDDSFEDLVDEIIEETNSTRDDYDVKSLKKSKTLCDLAELRAKEAAKVYASKGTLEHNRPNGTYFDTIFNEYGITYKAVAENLYGLNNEPSADRTVNAWLNSPTHRLNLLDENGVGYTQVGIGIVKSNGFYFVAQLFMK